MVGSSSSVEGGEISDVTGALGAGDDGDAEAMLNLWSLRDSERRDRI